MLGLTGSTRIAEIAAAIGLPWASMPSSWPPVTSVGPCPVHSSWPVKTTSMPGASWPWLSTITWPSVVTRSGADRMTKPLARRVMLPLPAVTVASIRMLVPWPWAWSRIVAAPVTSTGFSTFSVPSTVTRPSGCAPEIVTPSTRPRFAAPVPAASTRPTVSPSASV